MALGFWDLPYGRVSHQQQAKPNRRLFALILAMETFQLSFPLPRSLEARVFVHLTVQAKCVMIFLTTAAADELATPPPMGSFVYALPDVSCSLLRAARPCHR